MDDWAFAKQHPALLRCYLRYVSAVPPSHREILAGAATVGSWSQAAIVQLQSHSVDSALNRRFSAAHLALMINNVGAIRALLQEVPKAVLASQQTEQGMTLLHAALVGNVSKGVVDELLRCGCSATARTQYGHTCAMFAALGGNVSFLERFYSLDCTFEGSTLMTFASTGGSLKAVKYVYAHGGDLQADDRGCSPIFGAAFSSIDVLRYISKTLDPSSLQSRTSSNWTVMMSAAHGGHIECIEYLLAHGCRIDEVSDFGITPMMCAAQSLLYCDELVEYMVAHAGAAVPQRRQLDAMESGSWTFFVSAAKGGNLRALEYSLSHLGESVDAKTEDGSTPLTVASSDGRAEAMRFLLERGANVHAQDRIGDSVVALAAFSGNVEALRTAIAFGADTATKTPANKSILSLAVGGGNVDAMKLAMGYGFSVDEKGPSSWGPIHTAASAGSVDGIKFVWERCRARDVDIRTDDGETPLLWALSNGHLEAAKYLLSLGADIHATTKKGWNAMMFAAQSGCVPVMEFLLAQGLTVDFVTDSGYSVCYAAALGGHTPSLDFAYKHGAKLVSAGKTFVSPAAGAAQCSCLPVLRYLFAHGVGQDPEVTSGLPFEVALRYGTLKTIVFFLEHGASLDLVRNDETTLMLAAGGGNARAMKMLMERGARVSDLQPDGWGVVHCAALSGKSDAIRVALEYGGDLHATRPADNYSVAHAAAYVGMYDALSFVVQCGGSLDPLSDGRSVAATAKKQNHDGVARFCLSVTAGGGL